MKKYEKPTVTLVSLSANTMFCSSVCENDVMGGNADQNYKDLIDMGGFTEGRNSCSFPVDVYCKFTSSADSIVFNS